MARSFIYHTYSKGEPFIMKRFISSIVALGVGLILSGSIGVAAST
ncbi:hypothetical protein HMPREF0495_01628, partial [Levilactobacillus brevis ATCC 14869 = DSM 20054]